MNNFITPVTVVHNSGILLQLLDMAIEMDFGELKSKTDMNDMNFYMAIGYLTKEHKVIFFEGKEDMRIRLVQQ